MRRLVTFDWAIKYLLRNKANFDVLEGFLSELLKRPIEIVSILESESNRNNKNEKFNRVDLLVENSKTKEKILIEVQCERQWDYLCRMLYGVSRAICDYLKGGTSYKDVTKVISVNVLFFDLGQGADYIYHGRTQFQGMHLNDHLQLTKKEAKMYGMDKCCPSGIFPEYYLLKVNQFNQQVKDKFDEWMYFLKNEKVEPGFSAKGVREAVKRLDILNLNDSERAAYESYELGLHYEASMYESAQIDLEFAKEEGIKKGIEKGMEKGIEKGMEKGRLEEQKKIATNLLKLGQEIQIISRVTGLAISEIKKLRDQ